jgi:hypothetical protein
MVDWHMVSFHAPPIYRQMSVNRRRTILPAFGMAAAGRTVSSHAHNQLATHPGKFDVHRCLGLPNFT